MEFIAGVMTATVVFLIFALVRRERSYTDAKHLAHETSEYLRDAQLLNSQIVRDLCAKDQELASTRNELSSAKDELMMANDSGVPNTIKYALEDAIAQAHAVKQVQSSQMAAIVTDTMLVDVLIDELKSMRSHGNGNGNGHKHNPDKPSTQSY